ncbi:MAG TPA: alginate lyase family protein [Gemmatimonadaceae bacterium]|nr:alginate lyase family protein [Gemmatimonadaceae bacterium]
MNRLSLTLIAAMATAIPAGAAVSQTLPHVFALRPEALVDARALVRAHDPSVMPAYEQLLRDADKALVGPLVAVTDKHTLLPPSGDKHDYYSLSPYWWPDSTKAGGLPYVRHDGVTNPESKHDLDQPRVAELGDHVQALALAYYLSGNEKYAARAAQQLRTWFLDSATKMNPHLRYAQLVRGNPKERGSGIIDTRWFIEVVEGIGLLQGSPAWTDADQRGLQQWFTAYEHWLLTSPNGKHEHAAKNNHGSWYAAQTSTIAMFVGDTATARMFVNEAKARIGWQITPTGEQPIELLRTRSMHYSGFNVEALSRLSEVARQLGVDLWHYQAPEGGSLKKAIDHLAEYMVDPAKWPGTQIDPVTPDLMVIHLRRANWVYGGPTYRAVLAQLPQKVVRTDRSALLYPDKNEGR